MFTPNRTIEANLVIRVVVTSLDHYYGKNGLLMPANGGKYQFKISTDT